MGLLWLVVGGLGVVYGVVECGVVVCWYFYCKV